MVEGHSKVPAVRSSKRLGRKRLARPRRLVLALLLALILAVGAGFVRRQIAIIRLQAEIKRVQAEIGAVQSRNENLRQQIEHMAGPEYVEKAAREKLGLVMPGETVYDIAEPKDFASPFDVPKRNSSPEAGY